jgi:hypothetical protein
VEGALVRALVGKDLSRVYRVSGKQLIVASIDPAEHWKVTWEHYWAKNESNLKVLGSDSAAQDRRRDKARS